MAKFKIGDRVHYDDRLTKGVGTIHLRAPENEGFDWGVAVAEHDRKRGYHKGNIRWFLARDLRPALTPGRHYRTRNGKVTGRVSKGDTGFEAVVDGRVRIFDKAGGAVHGDDDIVEAWVPKVGERVRFVRDNTDSGAEYGAKGEVVTVMSEASEVGNCQIDVSSSHLSWNPGAYLSDLEPLPVAAPQPAAQEPDAALKIEAGRYYKTRDGRKVRVDHNPHYDSAESDSYPWKHDCGYGGYHGLTETGTSCINHSGSDLIAEWQETANVSAQVDAINEEYGPAPANRKLVRTGQGYGYELARFGDYVWVDTGKTAPITLRADKLAA